MFLRNVQKKYQISAGPVVDIKTKKEIPTGIEKERSPLMNGDPGDIIKGKPGDVIQVTEGANPHKNGDERKVIITMIGPDRHGDGFYYFYGDGKPISERQARPNHSNMFVWGIVDWKKIGSHPFKEHKYKSYTWTHTGIPAIDLDMANLDGRYKLFDDEAPKWAHNLYNEQEDQNYHSENAKMVDDFAGWMSTGKKAEDFPHPETGQPVKAKG